MSARGRNLTGRIHIVGGSLRNSRLDVPDLDGLRPTSQRVRETLFNWLAPSLAGYYCLDLCAGTGALGIEALSRGAAAVQFVEPSPAAAQALRNNLARLKHASNPVAMVGAAVFLQGPPSPQDVVFLDPPFTLSLWAELALQLEHGGWLRPNAQIYVESPKAPLPVLPANWQLKREGVAGEVRYALYRRQQAPVLGDGVG